MKHLTILLTLLLATSVWAESWSPNAKGLICTWEKENKTYDYKPISRFIIDVDKEKIKIEHINETGELFDEFSTAWIISWTETVPSARFTKFKMILNRETLALKMHEEITDSDFKLNAINSNTARCEIKSAQALLEEIKEKYEKNWKEYRELEEEQRKKNKI